MLTRFTDILCQEIIESGAWICMTVLGSFLVIMAELDNHVVTWFHLLQHLIPTSFVNERQRGTAVHGMVVNDDIVIEETLQGHPPPSLQLTFRKVFVSCGRVADYKNRSGLVWHCGSQHQGGRH